VERVSQPLGDDGSADTGIDAGADEREVPPRVDGAETVTTDVEAADALVAYVRQHQHDQDGSGEWLPFALRAFERTAMEAERKRFAALAMPLVEALTTIVPNTGTSSVGISCAPNAMPIGGTAAQAARPPLHPAAPRGAAAPAGASVWLKAKDIQELLGCCRSQSYEHLHRAGGGPACRVRLDAWERYAAVTFDCASTKENRCTRNPASDPAGSIESSTRESTSTASALNVPPGPRSWRKRDGSLLNGSARPPKIREIIPRARQRSSKP
jgi:hypothetical protein